MQPEKTDFKLLAKELFTTHPNIEVFYFTSDGQAFEHEHHAHGHTSNLKDKTITETYRPETPASVIAARKAQKEREAQESAEAAYRDAFPEIAQTIDYNKRVNRK